MTKSFTVKKTLQTTQTHEFTIEADSLEEAKLMAETLEANDESFIDETVEDENTEVEEE